MSAAFSPTFGACLPHWNNLADWILMFAFPDHMPFSTPNSCTYHQRSSLGDNRTRVDGKFLGPGGVVPASQAICSSFLEECFEIAQEIKAHEDSKNVASSLKPIYDRLNEIRAELESLMMTHRWSLRETDLWNYSLSLQEIDKMRVDGKFVDSEGNRPAGQYASRL